MAQKTFVAGDPLASADVNTYLSGEGGAWTSWTPAITQSGAVTCTVDKAAYARYGRTIIAHAYLSVTGSGTVSNNIYISLPVASVSNSIGAVLGSGWVYDTSASTNYMCALRYQTTTTVALLSTSGGVLGIDVALTLASGDKISLTVTYEAAS